VRVRRQATMLYERKFEGETKIPRR
jgi:hypothetical protein